MAVEPKRKLTYEEWLTFPDDGLRTELIDGEVWEMPEPTLWHQELLGRLYYAIAGHLRAHGGAKVVITPNLRLSAHQGYAPDLLVVREIGDDPLTIHGAPDLVIEIVSDQRRDLVVKRARYEEHAVPEYWAVLPDADRIEVYRLAADGYAKPRIVEPPETLSPLVLPDLVIDLGDLFRR